MNSKKVVYLYLISSYNQYRQLTAFEAAESSQGNSLKERDRYDRELADNPTQLKLPLEVLQSQQGGSKNTN